MSATWVAALVGAAVSAILTVTLLAWWAKRHLLPELEARLDARLEAAGAVLAEGVAASVGAELEEVAGSLVPRIREEVKGGVTEALAGALRGDLLAPTAKSAVRAGASVVGMGLELLLGRSTPVAPPSQDDDEP